MLSGTLSRSIGSNPSFQGLRGSVASSASHAQKAARTLKPAIAIVQLLRCIAFAAVVSVVGTFTCFQTPGSAHFHGDRRSRSSGTGAGNDAVLHAFLDRPVLCAFVITAACTLGLAFRAKPRFQKILELHSRRSLAIRAAFIAAIVLLEVHALRRVGATGVALAGISLQYLILPTLALVLLGRGNGTVPAKKLQGVLVITGAIVLLFGTSHFLSSSGTAATVPHATPGHSMFESDGSLDDAFRLGIVERNSDGSSFESEGAAANIAAAALASSLSGTPQAAPLSFAQEDRHSHHEHHDESDLDHEARVSLRDSVNEDRGSALDDRVQQRRRARRHGRDEAFLEGERKSSGRRLLVSSGMQPSAERFHGDRGREPQERLGRIPSRQRQYVVRLLATWKGVKCTAVACVFVALAATLQVVKTSYFQLFGVKRAGALFLPMETLTTGVATAFLVPFTAWEHFRSSAAVSSMAANEVVVVHGQKFVAANTVQSLWQSIWAALLLLFVGLVFAAAVVVDHAAKTPRRKMVPVSSPNRQKAVVHGTAVFVALSIAAAALFHSHGHDGAEYDTEAFVHTGLVCHGIVEQFMCSTGLWPKVVVALATAGIVFGLRIGTSGGEAAEVSSGGGLPWSNAHGNPFAASALDSRGRASGELATGASELIFMGRRICGKAVAAASRVLFGKSSSNFRWSASALEFDFEADENVLDGHHHHRAIGLDGHAGVAFGGSLWHQFEQACQFFARAVLQPENTVGGSAAAVRARRQTRRLVMFLAVNVLFMIVELVVGFYSNSLSLLGDAGHMFFDCAALVIGLIATYVSKWDGSARFTYGYRRAEVISGFANGVFLLLIAGTILCHAAWRLVGTDEQVQVLASHVLPVSVVGFFVNVLGLVFFYDVHTHHGHSHGEQHDHGHSHGHAECHGHGIGHSESGELDVEAGGPTVRANGQHADGPAPFSGAEPGADQWGSHRPDLAKKWWQRGADWVLRILHIPMQQDLNMRGVFLHVLADTLGSASVIVSSLLIQLFDWHWFDCISAAFTAGLIVLAVGPLVREAALILLQQMPPSRQRQWDNFMRAVQSLKAVERIVDGSVWALSEGHLVATLQVSVRPDSAHGGAYSIEQDTLQRIHTLSTHMLQRIDDSPPDLTIEVHRLEAQSTEITSEREDDEHSSIEPAQRVLISPGTGLDTSETPASDDLSAASQTGAHAQKEGLELGDTVASTQENAVSNPVADRPLPAEGV